ncbi:uncharacterized protein H6S33_008632 [Morchella sextelata]|uniref:uncharacterized protein n=1 Tax=Morchella sextelata TaxID=1174677 RepID=UPI001D036A29|nr:uncharacterized protein H6S33_008632 [Morchella sextelata]KAH0602551.1 hypothetical protein H6S33_008632 [Morchella sextelata]
MPRLKPGANQGKKKSSAPNTPPSEEAAAAAAAQAEDKKPLTPHEIIGGKSWTGKLPQTLFYELCIKNGWQNPEYVIRKEGNLGFISTVYIRCKNPKTLAIETLHFRPPTELPNGLPLDPPPHKPTQLEARHYTATYALHRVSSMRNIHLMLPPSHRTYWATFDDVKKAWFEKKHAWMYEADPFLTKREHDAALAKAARVAAASGGTPGASQKSEPKPPSRGWDNVPVVDMSAVNRRAVESLVRRHHVWNPAGIVMPAAARDAAVAELAGLGFRKVHAEEACGFTKDREEALEWLLVHVPEDDLPERFLLGNYTTGVTLQTDLEYPAKRLCANGYSMDLCRDVLLRVGSDEARAAEVLMQILLHGDGEDNLGADGGPPQAEEEEEEDLISFDDPVVDLWREEQTSLEAIWADRYTRISDTRFRVRLELREHTKSVISLDLRKPTARGLNGEYPHTIPVISLLEEKNDAAVPGLPAYIKLSIIRQTATFAESLRGEMMVFSLVDWLESEFARILENPGRLRDVAGAVSAGETGPEPTLRVGGSRPKKRRPRPPIDWTPNHPESMRLFEARAARWETPMQQMRIEARKRLPAWNLQEDIIAAVDGAQVTIISGETGSGKSTQSVQFILDDMILRKLGRAANIICTQPRRISALGLADRVAEERCGTVGDEIGYAIRGESRQKQGVTKITFVTTGVLLRRLQMGDKLEDVSHVVVDEVHERSLDTDFLLILLKRMLAVRQDLRVVLMSATLDADVFADYFGGAEKVRRVEIQGRTYPVQDFYLDQVIVKTRFDAGGRMLPSAQGGGGGGGGGGGSKNAVSAEDLRGIDPGVGNIIRGLGDRINYNLIAATVAHIDEELGVDDGAILIFLPGTMEIQRCIDAIKYVPDGSYRFHALPLHASLLPAEQRRVFHPPPPGKRKVIAATNVAETSITIEDVVAVIDTGRVKETSYDPSNNLVKLLETWASKAACKQRRGRAGRVAAGSCYKLYTRNAESKMPDRPEPELLRVPLEQTCLGVKHMGVSDVQSFLGSALSPPATLAVDGALHLLERMGALRDGSLTALGKHMAMIPADLRCSKLMVYGATFGCLDATVAIASIVTTRSPFVAPAEHREAAKAARAAFAGSPAAGDLVADLRAFEKWAELRSSLGIRELRKWCDENFLSHHALLDIASNGRQYLDALKEIGFLPLGYAPGMGAGGGGFNRHGGNTALLRGLVAGAFVPCVARVVVPETRFASRAVGAVALDPEGRMIRFYTEDAGRVFVHPGSTMFAVTAWERDQFLGFCTKMGTGGAEGKVYLRECTPINAYSLLLFGGDLAVDTMGRGITVDGWLRLRGWGRIGTLVAQLRGMLERVLERKIEEPEMDLGDNEVVGVARGLLQGNGM